MKYENYQAGELIIEQDIMYDRAFILKDGEIELFFHLRAKDIYFDVIKQEGCLMNAISCITQDKIVYSARAKTSVTIISISLADM